MHFKKILLLFLFASVLFGCLEMRMPNTTPQIIPIPMDLEITGNQFILDSSVGIIASEEFQVSSSFLKNLIESGSSIEIQNSNEIEFIQVASLKPEAYELNIQSKKISIKASSDIGAFYAVQSLRQLLPVGFEGGTYANSEVAIQCLNINDQPEFSYRGMHLDVGRHMFSVDFIKKYIDALAMLKMNTFHWHLTEDQGWRIEIKKYPKLQEVAAYRDETLVGHYSDQPHQFDGKKYGGYYTQEEVRDIVAYAEERFVTIIPEIEMPGHSQAAIAAYPELGCTGEPVQVAKKWGVFEEIYCPNEFTFRFLEDVLDEVMELFPSKYIHIGGDEAPKARWKNSEFCQDFIKKHNLKDEHGLQSYFIQRMEKYLNSKGRQIIGWDEILEGGLASNATVMSWRGVDGAVAAAKAGHNVIITPTSHCYFDYYQSENDDEPLAIGGYLPLEKVYSFNPIPEELTEDESKYVLGSQGNIWTEYMPKEDQVEYMMFPRVLAMSEILWSHSEQRIYNDFVGRVENFHKRLKALDINYANHLYEIEGQMVSLKGETAYRLESLTQGKTIRFTLDGTEPNVSSDIYTSEISITESCTLKAAVFNDNSQIGSTFTKKINYHKAVDAKIRINKHPHEAYYASGAEGLINGVSGSDARYGDKEWLGFLGEDIEITIDLNEEKKINSVETRFHNGNGQWIYAPKAVHLKFTLDDGTIITDVKELNLKNENLVNFKYDFKTPEDLKVTVKSLSLMILNYGTIPEGKQGAGNKSWTFIDEIIIN
jgi:hexosaminidase